jgi:hypothetical protein
LLRILSAVVFMVVIAALGCSHRPAHPAIWQFNHCAENAGHQVCTCEHSSQKVDAQTGQIIIVCD